MKARGRISFWEGVAHRMNADLMTHLRPLEHTQGSEPHPL